MEVILCTCACVRVRVCFERIYFVRTVSIVLYV
uniref:Uncharacterized protein n=1 Tax=Anguilla anguilla TaxID=7936 RepID=A0A0E9UQU7_ANGAN